MYFLFIHKMAIRSHFVSSCNRYESLMGTVAKKFSTKRKRSSIDLNLKQKVLLLISRQRKHREAL